MDFSELIFTKITENDKKLKNNFFTVNKSITTYCLQNEKFSKLFLSVNK